MVTSLHDLTVTFFSCYILKGLSCSGDRDAAAARTIHPIPPACGIYYYEVDILCKGQKG